MRVVDRPHPLPPRWRADYAWHIDTDMVRALAAELSDGLGSVAGTDLECGDVSSEYALITGFIGGGR